MGKAAAPDWLAVTETLLSFHAQRGRARGAFARFVAYGVDADDPYDQMPRAGLGEESFIETVLDNVAGQPIGAEVPKRLRPARSLEQIERHAGGRDRAIAEAHATCANSLTEIACYFGITYPRPAGLKDGKQIQETRPQNAKTFSTKNKPNCRVRA